MGRLSGFKENFFVLFDKQSMTLCFFRAIKTTKERYAISDIHICASVTTFCRSLPEIGRSTCSWMAGLCEGELTKQKTSGEKKNRIVYQRKTGVVLFSCVCCETSHSTHSCPSVLVSTKVPTFQRLLFQMASKLQRRET